VQGSSENGVEESEAHIREDAQALNDQGAKPRSGTKWHDSTVNSIVTTANSMESAANTKRLFGVCGILINLFYRQFGPMTPPRRSKTEDET
jgi:hypothetical protein